MNPTARAAIWMSGAIVSFTLMAVAGRAVSFALDTFEIMLFRSLFGLAVVLIVARFAGTMSEINSERLGLHILRNIAHFSGQNLWFYAITVLPLAQVFAFEFTTPIWVILLAPLLLGERLTRIGVLSAVLGFTGVLIVIQPTPASFDSNIFYPAAAAIGFAFTAIFTSKLTRSASITCIMFWLTFLQLIFGLIFAGYDGDITLPDTRTLPWLLLIGLAGLVAHFCLTKALSIAPASTVVPMDFIRLPLIAGVGALVYQEPLEPWVFVGAAVIFAAIYLNISRGKPV